MITFEKFETVYWVAGEDRNFEVLEGKIVDILYNGEIVIECDRNIYLNVLSFCCFKHDEDGKKQACEWAKHFINAKMQEYHLKISELAQVISEITGDDEDSQYKKLKRVAIKDRLE